MTTETVVNQYRVWCIAEAQFVITWGTVEPTVCPNDHVDRTIDPSRTVIIRSIENKLIRVEEKFEGFYTFETIPITIPSGSVGDVTSYDITFPSDVLLWTFTVYPSTDLLNDSFNIVIQPETTVGFLTAAASTGETTLSVSAGILTNTNIIRGTYIIIDDGVNKEHLGRITARDEDNNTITVETPLVNNYAMDTLIKAEFHAVRECIIHQTDHPFKFLQKGIQGRVLTQGFVVRVNYTNNDTVAKTFYLDLEYYNLG